MTTSASVFSSRYLAVSASWQPAKRVGRSDPRNDRARSVFARVDVSSPVTSNSSPAEHPIDGVGGALFLFAGADRTADAQDLGCDRRPGDRGRGRTAAQTSDGFRPIAPGIIAGAGGVPVQAMACCTPQGRRRVPQGQSAPPADYLALCRSLIIDCGLGKLGQAFVGFLLFGQSLVEQLRGLRIVQLDRPGLQRAVA
jgi:hypothetical protein